MMHGDIQGLGKQGKWHKPIDTYRASIETGSFWVLKLFEVC